MTGISDERLDPPKSQWFNIEEYVLSFTRLAALGSLSSAIMHDLRNALTILSGNLQILLMKGSNAEAEEITTRLERMMEQLDRAEATIARAESFSKRAEGNVRNVLPHKAVDNALFTFSHQLGKPPDNVVNSIPSTDKVVDCDAGLLEFIILELLRSSFDERREGELRITGGGDNDRWEMTLDYPWVEGNIDPAGGASRTGLVVAALAAVRMGGEVRRLAGEGKAGWLLRVPWKEV